jgi:predicted Zn-dependent protease
MNGFLKNLGQRAAPTIIKTRWIYRSLTGTESEKIQAEYGMGCYLTYLHTREGNLDRDPDMRQWLNALADRLALTVVNRERRFQVRCVGGPEANAFALPGGFLFVSRALIELCEGDADEIAFVLAHEMAHVLRSHSVNRLLSSEIARLASRGSLMMGAAGGAIKPLLAQLIHRLLTQGYSRQQEFEADRVAVQITRVAGYDPLASIRLFQRLQQQSHDPGAMAGYFSSHPTFPLRIERIRRVVGSSAGA